MRNAPIVGRLAWAVLVLVQATGCILVIPPFAHDAHCGITGTSACAACLRTSCQPAIDVCCNDSSCRGVDGHSAILDGLDACGGGDAKSCASGIGNGDSASAASVRACVVGSCKEACVGGAPVKVDWSCNAPRAKDNACSTCIYESCTSAVDGCCDDASCKASRSIADDLGMCIGGDAAACTFGVSTKSTSGFEGKLRSCIAKSCTAPCLGDQRKHEACQLEGGGAYCQCSDAEKSSGPECSVASMGGNCVLGQKGCTCGHYACERSGSSTLGGCSCAFKGAAGSSTRCDAVRTSSGSHSTDGRCCLHVDASGTTCECKDYLSKCYADTGEYDTPSCNLEDVLPLLKNVLVDRCSN
jgi:hypothetical protein